MVLEEGNAALIQAIRELRQTINALGTIYMRQDVYAAQRERDRDEVEATQADVSEIKGTLRWLSRAIVAGAVFPLVTSLILLYVAKVVGG